MTPRDLKYRLEWEDDERNGERIAYVTPSSDRFDEESRKIIESLLRRAFHATKVVWTDINPRQ